MSYCKRDGKDISVFVTEEDIGKPAVVTSLAQEEEYGILLPSGELNWDCPCLGGMAYGPCGQEFKDAFSCFHYSEEEEKGSDCIPQFKTMQECFQNHPEVYSKYNDEDDKDEGPSENNTLPTDSIGDDTTNESTKTGDTPVQETA